MELVLGFRRRREQLKELLAGHARELPQRAKTKTKPATSNRYETVAGFEQDYPAFLVALAASIRTGIDPLSALTGLQDLFAKNSALGREIGKVAGVIEAGGSEDDAIAAFGARIAHPDLPLFRSAFILARREGSSLGSCLERLASVTRARQSFRRKTRAAVAMQRLSAFGIAGCAVLITVMQVVASGEAVRNAINHPVGSRLLALGASLVIFGLVWMLRLTRTRV